MPHDAYIRKETLVSMAINGVLSAVFFLLIFGLPPSVAVWGAGNWIFDFLPQSFMITLMSTLVPGALTARRIKAGLVEPAAFRSRLPHPLVLRALVLAILTALSGTALVAAIAALTSIEALPLLAALGGKVIYGIVLGAIVTPIGLRAALSSTGPRH